ncbi:MAG: hypothetical protein LBD68_08685 [Zoogloeaceae bacterium]|jgi:hypothetical protein|nr:hypothetical protein [Zoogloeaceae bacterium]
MKKVLLSCCLLLSAGGIQALSGVKLNLDFSVGQIRHDTFNARNVRLNLEGAGGALTLENLNILGQVWPKIRISCARLQPKPGAFACEQGRLHLAEGAPIALQLTQKGENWRLVLQPAANERWELLYSKTRVRLLVQDGNPLLLPRLIPDLAQFAAWRPQGKLNGRLDFSARAFEAQFALRDGLFNSPDGSRAAENLTMTLNLSGQGAARNWRTQGRLEWQKGTIYHAPALLNAEAQSLEFAGVLDARTWSVEHAALHFPRVGALRFRGTGDWQKGIQEGELRAENLEMPALGETLLAPMLAGQDLPPITLQGRLGLTANWRQGAFDALKLASTDAGFLLDKGSLALEGLSGELEWRQTGEGKGDLRVGKMALGRLESGTFQLPLAIWPRGFTLARQVDIPVLDGTLAVTYLTTGKDAQSGEWEGAMGFSLSPLSLEKLTQILDLPVMYGMLSANLPRIRYLNREAYLEGALVIQVFEGYLNCTDFRFIDPFGARPRLLADVNARNINLAQLTQTFSFGQITGFIDADLKGLELAANWQPLAFDARIASSPGHYSRRISQRAVDNITSLGGGGAMAIIQKSALRFFEDFGYRNIGLACRLENGVCRMSGIDGMDRGEQYTIVAGGGIPALTVMGYTRRVDWQELVTRIRAATQSSGAVIGNQKTGGG